jgi:hypothetical protein
MSAREEGEEGMNQEIDTSQLDKMAAFESRMGVVERDNPVLAQACRSVHQQLSLAKTVAESVFSPGLAKNPEILLAISSSIAEEVDTIMDEIDRQAEGGDEEEEGELR